MSDSSNETSELTAPVEASEFKSPEPDALGQTERALDEAAKLFRGARAPRGEAAVELRRGYLSILRDEPAQAVTHARQAETLSDEAGDGRAAHLALTHRVMASLATGSAEDMPALARNRWSRHWLIRRGDYDRALAGYRTARELFQALGAQINLAQNLADQGRLLQAVGDRAGALTLFEESLEA